MEAAMDLQVLKVEIAKLELNPSNVLVVRVPVGTEHPAISNLEAGLRLMLGGSQPFVIVTDEIKFTVLARSDVSAVDAEDENRA
jgi:hypothetical protein